MFGLRKAFRPVIQCNGECQERVLNAQRGFDDVARILLSFRRENFVLRKELERLRLDESRRQARGPETLVRVLKSARGKKRIPFQKYPQVLAYLRMAYRLGARQ